MRVHPVSPQTMCETIKTNFRTYCSISNIHGVHYLTSKRSRTERVVWAILLTISISCCIFMIAKIWQKFEKNPIVISFGTEDVSIHEVPFPAFTICPEMMWSKSKFDFDEISYRVLHNETVSEEDFKKYSYLSMVCTEEEELIGNEKSMEEDFFAFLKEVKANFTLSCAFLGFSCTDYMVPIITELGICYSFNILRKEDIFRDGVVFFQESEILNSSDFKVDSGYDGNTDVSAYPLRAHTAGQTDALDFIFWVPNSELGRDSLCISPLEGFTILIHNPMDIPQVTYHYLTNIPDNKLLLVRVEPDVITTSEEVKSFNPDKRRCYLSHERPLKFFLFYTQSNCYMECFGNFTLKRCDCLPFFLPRMEGDKMCGAGSAECIIGAKEDMLNDDMLNKMVKKKSQCDCLPSCTSWKYKSETSLMETNFKRVKKSKFAKTSLAEELDGLTGSVASVSFKSNQFMVIERKELFGVTDLISNFGGLLGLFIGFSLMSLMEIVYFCTWRLFFNKKLYGNWRGDDK